MPPERQRIFYRVEAVAEGATLEGHAMAERPIRPVLLFLRRYKTWG